MLVVFINFSFLYFFIIYNSILLLFVVFDEYKRISQKDIEQSIKSETSGSFEDALLAIGKLVGAVCVCRLPSLLQVCSHGK